MSVLTQFKLFAHYNQLMNQRQFEAVALLSSEDLHRNQRAFFQSVFGTLNHILLADVIWLKRFAIHPSCIDSLAYIIDISHPDSLDEILFMEFKGLREERIKIDELIVNWIASLSDNIIDECLSYNNMAGDPYKKSFESLISHLFMHQVHHRGQVTTLLNQCGVDFGETDLLEIIDGCND